MQYESEFLFIKRNSNINLSMEFEIEILQKNNTHMWI